MEFWNVAIDNENDFAQQLSQQHQLQGEKELETHL